MLLYTLVEFLNIIEAILIENEIFFNLLELNILYYIINGIRIATTLPHKSLAKLPLAIVNPN